MLIQREFNRLFKEPSRLLGMTLQPLLFLFLFGYGFSSFEKNYLGFFYPGILSLVILFSSVYSTLSLVEDRNLGFFCYVSLGPYKLWAAVLGKLLGTFLIAFLQSLVFLLFIFFMPINFAKVNFLSLIISLILGGLLFSIIGVLFAFLAKTPSAFHALMSAILFPLWLLSGAMFPLKNAFNFLNYLNPMSFLVTSIKNAIEGNGNLLNLNLLMALVLCSILLFMVIKKQKVVR